MTNLLAVVGSPKKGKATDIPVDKAIEGAKSKDPNCNIKKINLIERDSLQTAGSSVGGTRLFGEDGFPFA